MGVFLVAGYLAGSLVAEFFPSIVISLLLCMLPVKPLWSGYVSYVDRRKKEEGLMQSAFPPNGEANRVRSLCLECGKKVTFLLNGPTSQKCLNGHDVEASVTISDQSPPSIDGKVYCRRSGAETRVVSGKDGKFWGCKQYPESAGIQSHALA